MAKSVLIVEDDNNIAELLRLYLEKEGYRANIASDGEAGVRACGALQPDIVLLDIMLPLMDGWAVLRNIRKSSNVPVIMLTAKGETMDKVSGLKMGADDYITKPFEMKEVLARIEAVLRRGTSEMEQDKGRKRLDHLTSLSLIWTPLNCWWTAKRWIHLPRRWNYYTTWPLRPNRVYTRNQLLDEVLGL